MRPPEPTRLEFLQALAGTPLLAGAAATRKALIVAAHPDDEYAVAASAYHLAREAGWLVDHVVITNGEGGYRYAALAEAIYGVPLTAEKDGRRNLPPIRKQETLNAGKVLGVRNHYFLDQRDSGFGTDATVASTGDWDRGHIVTFLSDLLGRENYDVILVLLPTHQTHAHHRETALLTLEAVSRLHPDARPAVIGADPGVNDAQGALIEEPKARLSELKPLTVFDRNRAFGFRNALNYKIVVNWVIAEHKSQGLFQSEGCLHDQERFWLFALSGQAGESKARAFAAALAAKA